MIYGSKQNKNQTNEKTNKQTKLRGAIKVERERAITLYVSTIHFITEKESSKEEKNQAKSLGSLGEKKAWKRADWDLSKGHSGQQCWVLPQDPGYPVNPRNMEISVNTKCQPIVDSQASLTITLIRSVFPSIAEFICIL